MLAVVDGNVWSDSIWRSPPAVQNITVEETL